MLMTTAEDRSKHIDHYRYEIGACMMCGLCVEACPFDAIEMSHDYELARIDPATLTIDLVTDTPAAVGQAQARPQPPRRTPPRGPQLAPTAETPAAAEGGADV